MVLNYKSVLTNLHPLPWFNIIIMSTLLKQAVWMIVMFVAHMSHKKTATWLLSFPGILG